MKGKNRRKSIDCARFFIILKFSASYTLFSGRLKSSASTSIRNEQAAMKASLSNV
jgi:hypothetical protein